MSERLDPRMLFEMIAHDLPGELRPHVLVVGSLAAAYHFRDAIYRDGIATKDADCVIHPAGALMECQAIASQPVPARRQGGARLLDFPGR